MFSLNDFFYGTSAIGIELQMRDANSSLIHLVYLEKNKNKYTVIRSEYSLYEMGSIRILNNLNVPVSLVITGFGVTTRKFHADEVQSDEEMLKVILPEAVLSDYLVQKVSGSNNSLFVSIIKKKWVNGFLGIFEKNNISIVHLSLGPFALANINSHVNKGGDELAASQYQLSFENNLIKEFNSVEKGNDDHVTIHGKQLINKLAIAYATAFDFLGDNIVRLDFKSITRNYQDYKRKQVYKLLSIGSLLVFGAVIMFNGYASMHYLEQGKDISSKLFKKQNAIDDLISRKEKVKGLHLLSESIELDRDPIIFTKVILQTKPQNIAITLLKIFPREETERVDQPIIYNHQIIRIVGRQNNILEIKRWMKELGNLEGVLKVDLLGDEFDDSKVKDFILMIKLS